MYSVVSMGKNFTSTQKLVACKFITLTYIVMAHNEKMLFLMYSVIQRFHIFIILRKVGFCRTKAAAEFFFLFKLL